MLNNKQQINEIIIKTKSTNTCPIGGEIYHNNFRIEMIPFEYLPNYCDVDAFVTSNIESKNMIIEDAVFELFNYMLNTYHPIYLEIASHVTDAAHSEVTVVKRCGYKE